jgi:hypothetical protein
MTTVPLPLPLAPLVMLSQDADSDAVQVHPPAAVTEMFALPPTEGTARLVGATVNVHGAASCVTVTVWPATVKVVDRDVVAVFAAAV